MASNNAIPDTPADRLAAYFDESQSREVFDDSDIEEVTLLLTRLDHFARKAPRTYIVLRSIGQLEVLEQLLQHGFHDAMLPVEMRGLPDFIDPRIKSKIIQGQRVVLTKSKSTLLENGRHCHFAPDDPLPFVALSVIGSGSYGLVQKIESKVTFKQYALKTIARRAAFGNPTKQVMKDILGEIHIMKGLTHKHIVNYVGSYTDKRSFGIVMEPIAEQDLASYLVQVSATVESRPTLRTFFGCLATALAYLHDNSIRHRDLKPQNILVLKSNVLLTDFGLARDNMDTSSGPILVTSRYCAPEVVAREKRNESADVWSLGCIFLEMVAALQGHNVEWLKGYYATIDSGSTHFHTNPTATAKLLADWSVHGTEVDAAPLRWIGRMIDIQRHDRPSAGQIASQATALSMYSCDACNDTDDADSIGSLVADFQHDLELGREPMNRDALKDTTTSTDTKNSSSSVDLSPARGMSSEIAVVGDIYRGQVFGASLEICNRFSGFDTLFLSDEDNIKTRGKIPAIVVQCCDILCSATPTPKQTYLDLVAEGQTLSLADHEYITQLKYEFALSPFFIPDLDWKAHPKSRVYALKILGDYLHSLPEPLVDQFVSRAIKSFKIAAFEKAYHQMLKPNRLLLMYLLKHFGRLVSEARESTRGDASESLLKLGQTLGAIASRFHGVFFDIRDEERKVLGEKLLSNLIMNARKDKTLQLWESQRIGVFDVPLATSLGYAGEDISKRPFQIEGETYYVSGSIPIIVFRCCEFILRPPESGKEFITSLKVSKNANPRMTTVLKDAFNRAPTFGRKLDWAKFGPEEAAAILVDYLRSLPGALLTGPPRFGRLPFVRTAERYFLGARLYNVSASDFPGRNVLEADLDIWTSTLAKLPTEKQSILLYLLAFWARYVSLSVAYYPNVTVKDRVEEVSKLFTPGIFSNHQPQDSADNPMVILQTLIPCATYILDMASGGLRKKQRLLDEAEKAKQDAAEREAELQARDEADRVRRLALAERAKAEKEEKQRKKKAVAEEKRRSGFRARIVRSVDAMMGNVYIQSNGPAQIGNVPRPGLPPSNAPWSRPQQSSQVTKRITVPKADQDRTRVSRTPRSPSLASSASYDEMIRTLDEPSAPKRPSNPVPCSRRQELTSGDQEEEQDSASAPASFDSIGPVQSTPSQELKCE